MKKNPVQFQKGFSLVDFMGRYGTEAQCAVCKNTALSPYPVQFLFCLDTNGMLDESGLAIDSSNYCQAVYCIKGQRRVCLNFSKP